MGKIATAVARVLTEAAGMAAGKVFDLSIALGHLSFALGRVEQWAARRATRVRVTG